MACDSVIVRVIVIVLTRNMGIEHSQVTQGCRQLDEQMTGRGRQVYSITALGLAMTRKNEKYNERETERKRHRRRGCGDNTRERATEERRADRETRENEIKRK